MVDDNDARGLERHLIKLEGVISCVVNYVSGNLTVEYVPTVLSDSDIQNIISNTGFNCVVEDRDEYDTVKASRAQELGNHKRLLLIGSILTVPIIVLSMLSKVSWIADNDYVTLFTPWVLGVLTTPVQFYVGWAYYVAGYKSIRNRSANMDVLVAVGSSVAYMYSLLVLLSNFFGWHDLGEYVYFDTAAVIILFVRIGKYLELRTKGRAAESINRLLALQATTACVCLLYTSPSPRDT